jgi:iron(III) transport system ATP-binding protein
MTLSVRVQGLHKSYDGVAALSGLDLEIPPGQIHVLLGPSGCGKTTLLRSLAGFEQAEKGTIHIGDELIHGPDRCVAPEHRSIGMVFQDYALFPHLTVDQNVAFGVHSSKKEKNKRVIECLALTDMSRHRMKRPHELSGGEQQRIALARALAPEPGLILLDEPFSNLDAKLRVQIRSEIKKILRGVGSTAIFVTHDQEEALSLADAVSVMADGRILQSCSPETLYLQPINKEVAKFVGQSNFLPGDAKGPIVETAIGNLDLIQPRDGAVELLIRPEQIELRSAAAAPVTLESQEFLGDRRVVTVRTSSGRSLTASLWSWKSLPDKDTLSIKVQGPVHAWPA